MAEKKVRKKVMEQFEKVCENENKITFWYALMQPACASTSSVPRMIYLMYAGYLVLQGNITVGIFISVLNLLNYIISPTVYFPFLMNSLNKSIASINRIKKLDELLLDNNLKDNMNDAKKEFNKIKEDDINNIKFFL